MSLCNVAWVATEKQSDAIEMRDCEEIPAMQSVGCMPHVTAGVLFHCLEHVERRPHL